MPKFLDVTSKSDARNALEVHSRDDTYTREQTVGPGDALPNECGFWWVSEPVAVDGKVYMGTCAADNGSWVQEWTRPVDGGPFYLHRYFMGYTELSVFGEPDLRDDHNPAQFAVKAGKPLVVFWSPHGANARLYYRISDQNVDDARPGELTFGPIQVHAIDSDERTSYSQVMWHGDDIWVAHRTGYNVNKWSLTKFPDWGTSTPVQHDLVFNEPSGGLINQLYVKARMTDTGIIRCMCVNGPVASVYRDVWWFEVDTDSGDVTEADGTVLGNLDGTNLPLVSNTDLETVYSPPSGSRVFLMDTGGGASREMVWFEDEGTNATTTYRHARYASGTWTVNTITTVNQPNGQVVYFPIINFVPGDTSSVILTRADPTTATTGTHHVERWSTTNNGATWTKAETIDSAAYNSTGAGDRRALARAFPVRVESGTAPFDVIAAEIIDFPIYYRGWVIYTRPLPLSIPVKRVPPDDPIRNGLLTEPKAPAGGLYLPGTLGHYVQGPTSDATVPTDGIRLEVDVALPDWTPAAEITLFGKEKDGSNREPRLVVNTAGRIGVYWSEDGSTAQSAFPNDVPPFEPWQRVQIAAEFIPSHAHPTTPGAFQRTIRTYYRFSDDEPWTTLNVSQNSPATSIFTSDSAWNIGCRRDGVTDLAAGVYYRAATMTAGGQVLAEWRADRNSDQGIQVDPQGNTWTVKSRDAAITSPVITNLKTATVLDPDNNIASVAFESSGSLATPNYLLIRSSDTNPNIEAVGPAGNADIPIVLVPRGTSAVRILSGSSTPTLEGFGSSGNADFNLTTQSSGRVLINGAPAYFRDSAEFLIDVPHDLTSGENTFPRRMVSTANQAPGNGNLRLTYFTARRTETVTAAVTMCGAAAVGTTLARIGVYTVASNGDLTLVASTANDTALWSSTGTISKSFSASLSKTRGTRYAVGLLVVGTSTSPQMAGNVNVLLGETAKAPRLCGFVGSQTDLPATISAASVSDTGQQYYVALVP